MTAFEELLGHVIDVDFDTHQSMIEAALCWQLEEYQLDSGSFSGYIHAVHTQHIQIANTFRSNGVFVKGNTPKNVYLFAAGESEGNLTHNGLKVFNDELVVLSDTDQLDFVLSASTDDVTITVDKDFFDDAFEKYFNVPFQYNTMNNRIQLKENFGSTYRDSVKDMLSNLMVQHAYLKNDMNFHAKIEQEILQILFKNFDLSKERKNALESEMNANEIRKYIEMNYKNEISIHDLCNINKLSESTLRLGFKNLYGLSPKQYHQAYRLGKVHHAFLQNDSTAESVGSIAYDHGFTHMGRFSSKYKSMFGISPSTTLKESFNLAQ